MYRLMKPGYDAAATKLHRSHHYAQYVTKPVWHDATYWKRIDLTTQKCHCRIVSQGPLSSCHYCKIMRQGWNCTHQRISLRMNPL